jgi:hypothetical protein
MHPAADPSHDTTQNASQASGDITPPARSFATFLTTLEDGRLHRDLSNGLQEMAEFLFRHASTYGGKAKGRIALTMDLSTDDTGVFEIRCDFKETKPRTPFPVPSCGRIRPIIWCHITPSRWTCLEACGM